MADHGLNLYGNAIIVNTDYAKANSDVVKSFLLAIGKGWKDAVANPSSAIESLVKRNPAADSKLEERRFKLALSGNVMTDYVAKNGVLFNNAFVAAPGCSPSRAAILTGKNIWELEEAGTHASNFPSKYKAYTEVLEENGFFVGYTGKPWGPGNWEISGRKQNPAGK